MTLIRAARAIGGLLSITVLLSMVLLDFWIGGVHLSQSSVLLLTALISGLLGIDLISEHLPLEVTVESTRGDEEDD